MCFRAELGAFLGTKWHSLVGEESLGFENYHAAPVLHDPSDEWEYPNLRGREKACADGPPG